MSTLAWFDGSLVAPDQARVSVTDHAFTVGDAVFETMKFVDGVPFALSRHVRRLAASARGLGLPLPDEREVREAVAAVAAQPAAPSSGRMRITYGGGDAPMGSGRGDARPHLSVVLGTAAPWPATTEVVTVPWVRNERSAVAGLKTTSYAENVVAIEYAHARGASEALFANTRDELCEGTGSNVFVVLDGELLTPPLDGGCLAGITRALILDWCDAREAVIPMSDLARAEEIFLSSSTRDVHPVAVVDGKALASTPGPLTRKAADEFARRAGLDVDP